MDRREHTENPKMWTRRKAEDCLKQETVCKFILQELYSGHIELHDKHGSTVMQYLAGAMFPNVHLIGWLRSRRMVRRYGGKQRISGAIHLKSCTQVPVSQEMDRELRACDVPD